MLVRRATKTPRGDFGGFITFFPLFFFFAVRAKCLHLQMDLSVDFYRNEQWIQLAFKTLELTLAEMQNDMNRWNLYFAPCLWGQTVRGSLAVSLQMYFNSHSIQE